jgi:hypothetical protein
VTGQPLVIELVDIDLFLTARDDDEVGQRLQSKRFVIS